MKKIMSKSAAIRLVWLMLCATLFSFSNDLGGDTYEIHLNSKLLLQQRVWQQASVPEISLDQSMKNEQLSVYYSHCGQTGTGRTMSIRNEENKVLKEWNFADVATTTLSPMNIPLKDVAAFALSEKSKIQLFYSSKELSKGRALASIVLSNEAVVTGR